MRRSGLVGSLLGIVVLACSDTTPPTTTPVSTSTIAAPPTTAATTTTAALAAAPWAQPPLAASEVAVLATEWSEAENRESCAGLAPSGGVAGASPRPANFAGGWAVAWDAPDGPGMSADGTFCEDCGRSAVGVAGTGATVEEGVIRSWPTLIEWSDGSVVGYGIEGSIEGSVDNAATTGADSPTMLAFLSVAGQDCLYNIWSRRSETELVDVINRLRFVEGLGAPSG